VFPDSFIELLQASTGQADTVLEALEAPPSVSVRLNPAKLKDCPFPDATPVAWSTYGYLLKERPVFTMDPLFHAGCYYVQDTSAMFVGHVFRQLLDALEPDVTVLDLCAAPGGKSTDLAASLRERFGSRFSLLCNEVMTNRFSVLRNNLDTWGDPCTGCVSRDPSAFGDAPLFDIVVADVPCSGEGMFRKDAQAVDEWSLRTVEFCAARSRRILRDIWPALAPGGFLIYSTCTFNHFENDDTVEWIASQLGADILPPQEFPPVQRTRYGYALLPGLVPGEGQYVAALRKRGEADKVRKADVFRLFQAWRPQAPEESAPAVEVDRQTALRYLHGDAVVLPAQAPTGPVTLCFQGQPLGPGKNLGKRCNNLYPKAKRIKMDIR
jgi:16S rRNA C967 or C1407 C5-methylase (RsmB/RsmF family)